MSRFIKKLYADSILEKVNTTSLAIRHTSLDQLAIWATPYRGVLGKLHTRWTQTTSTTYFKKKLLQLPHLNEIKLSPLLIKLDIPKAFDSIHWVTFWTSWWDTALHYGGVLGLRSFSWTQPCMCSSMPFLPKRSFMVVVCIKVTPRPPAVWSHYGPPPTDPESVYLVWSVATYPWKICQVPHNICWQRFRAAWSTMHFLPCSSTAKLCS
jgi:hypothetical protein